MLNGSIDSVGGQYVVTLEATNASSGDSLGRQQAQADRKEDVLNALHSAATKLRGQLGESLATVQKYDMSLSQATTSSLDALKALSLGDAKHSMGDDLGAVPDYQHAIDLDPNFAMAYARLGTVYNNLGQTSCPNRTARKPSSFATAPASAKSSTSLRTITPTAASSTKALPPTNSIARPIPATPRPTIICH